MAYGYQDSPSWGLSDAIRTQAQRDRVEAIKKDLDTHGSYWQTYNQSTHAIDVRLIKTAAQQLGVEVKFRKRRERDSQATPSVTLHAEVVNYNDYLARRNEKILKAAERVAGMVEENGSVVTFHNVAGLGNPLLELKRLVRPTIYCDYPDCDHVPATHRIHYPSRLRPNVRCAEHMPKIELL